MGSDRRRTHETSGGDGEAVSGVGVMAEEGAGTGGLGLGEEEREGGLAEDERGEACARGEASEARAACDCGCDAPLDAAETGRVEEREVWPALLVFKGWGPEDIGFASDSDGFFPLAA